MSDRELIGHIDVDAGLCWVGDPCYQSDSKSLFEDWGLFCDKLFAGQSEFHPPIGHVSFGHDNEIGEGKGIAVSTGYGDGKYPVYITRDSDGRINSVTVDFTQEDEDEVGPDYDEDYDSGPYYIV